MLEHLNEIRRRAIESSVVRSGTNAVLRQEGVEDKFRELLQERPSSPAQTSALDDISQPIYERMSFQQAGMSSGVPDPDTVSSFLDTNSRKQAEKPSILEICHAPRRGAHPISNFRPAGSVCSVLRYVRFDQDDPGSAERKNEAAAEVSLTSPLRSDAWGK